MQTLLTVIDIAGQHRRVAPDGVGGRHVHRSIEAPAGPRVVLWRIARAVEEHPVYSGTEHQVEVGLHLREGGAEVLREPSERFARHQPLACNMSRRRGVLQHRKVGEVLARHAGVGAQTLDTKLRKPEAFYLRYVNRSIDVDEVGWRAMRLVPHLHAALMTPAHPLLREVLQQEVGKRLAIVADDLRVAIYKRLQLVLQPVASAGMELAEQRWRPVRAEHFVGIIEESGRQGCTGGLEGSVEARQVMGHGSRVEMVYHVALAARSRPFHLLPRAAFVEGDDSALAIHLALKVLLHYQASVWLLFLWSRQDDALG